MSAQTIETSAETLLGGRPTLILSPHMDDAMLSAAAICLSSPAQVWTLFTGDPVPPQTTSWDLSCGFADSHETITARRLEDEAAFADTLATLRHLDAWEGAYATPERRRGDLPHLRKEITAWLSEHPNGVLVLPACAGLHVPTPWWAGIRDRLERNKANSGSSPVASNAPAQASSDEAAGSNGSNPSLKTHLKPLLNYASRKAKGAVGRAMHIDAQRRRRKVIGEDGLAANPDHILVRDLGLELAKEFPNVQVILFEDLPYLWHERGDASAARVAQAHNLTFEKVSVPLDAQAKFDHLQRYASQMPVMDTAGRLTRRECIEAYENYWLLK